MGKLEKSNISKHDKLEKVGDRGLGMLKPVIC